MSVTKIISGGQTGGDQAGLAAAIELGLKTGGFVPKGKRIDGSVLSDKQMSDWGLVEHHSSSYPPRTLANVTASDGTVVFGNVGSPGCSLTLRYCFQNNKPVICNPTAEQLRTWVDSHNIAVLNVAGNRERTNPGIFGRTKAILLEALR